MSRCISSGDTSKEQSVCESLNFMEYIGKTTDETAENTDSKKIKRIHERVKQVRKSEKAGVRLMQKWEELAYEREDGIAEGMAKGLTTGIASSILELLEDSGPIPLNLREEIMAETSAELLKKWLRIAARAKNIEEFIENALLKIREKAPAFLLRPIAGAQ